MASSGSQAEDWNDYCTRCVYAGRFMAHDDERPPISIDWHRLVAVYECPYGHRWSWDAKTGSEAYV